MSKKSYTLKLTFSTLVTACIVLLIGIGWSFVLGVMVGRGYNPEKKIPQLATLLPDEEGKSTRTPPTSLTDTMPKSEVMKPEELRYSSTLKGKPGQVQEAPKPKNMQNATASVAQPLPASQGQTAEAQNQGGSLGGIEQTKTKPEKSAAPAAPPAAAEARFNFVFQVATFKDEPSVDKLRARLEGAGLRTRMDKDGKLLKVMVLLRGTNEQGQEVRQLMVDMGLGQPIQRSKTAVTAKKTR